MSYRFALAILGCLTMVSGCATPQRPTPSLSENRLNPPGLMTMEAVVHAINGNNDRIPSLWAALNYSATIHDNGQVHSVSSDDGVMMYLRPAGFRLVGKKEFVGTVFDIGSNGREYWLEVVPGTNRMWWGKYADLANVNADRLPIPIRPDLVMEVLPVAPINPNFNEQPVPTMRYDNASDQYVFVFNIKTPDRWLAEKEVAYDRATLRPWRVTLYDANGRPVLKAALSMDVRVQMPSGSPNDWPVVPGDYKLFFPDSGSTMEFSLKDVRLQKRVGRVVLPNPASFRLPDVAGTDVRAIQIGGGGA
ncbi:MAG TPA: hypothetical protein VGI81_03180 [Tepidisphaeraceae bacterium]